jgi:amidase
MALTVASSGEGTLWRLGAAELARLIRRGRVSCREAVAASLARLEAVNPRINAVVLSLAEEALAEADAADRALRKGEAVGPLHGVPVTIKVNTDQRGCPTDNGVVRFKDVIAAEDNPVVANLRRAGAVIIGRTNTPCFSMRWFTDNELHGRTLNPWHPERTPGGSSGGAGAAIATGIGPLAQGNDIGGSVRYPAYCCGVLGLRPTYGRIPTYNRTGPATMAISSQLMAVQGPLARNVEDLRLAFAAMAVPDIHDPRSLDVAAPPAAVRPLRAALAPAPGGLAVQPAIAAAVAAAGECLARAGWVVEEAEPPHFAETAMLWPRLAMADVMAQLEPLIVEHGDRASRRAFELWREMWPQRDPATSLAALADRFRLLRDWQVFLDRYAVLVLPVSAELPYEIDADLKDAGTTAAMGAAQSPLTAISALGLPGLSVPTGLAHGLPVGVQLVAGRHREDLCFDAAEIITAQLPMPAPIDPIAKPSGA